MSDIVSRNLSVHKEHEVLLKLETAGFGNVEAQAIIESKNNELATKIVYLIRRKGFEAPTSFKLANEIMGKNFLSPAQVVEHFGVEYGAKIDSFWEIPFSEAELQARKNTHILFAGFPLTINEIRSKVPKNLFPQLENRWYKRYAFAKADRVKMRWYLIKKDIVPESTSKTHVEQTLMLERNEIVGGAASLKILD
jgi:hypothetical protein